MTITLPGFSNTDWARGINTTLVNYLREQENAIVKNYQMLALLEAQGRMVMNCGGRGFQWQVLYNQHAVEGNNGETVRQYSRVNLWKQAALEYRGYQATDFITRKELLENRGPEALIPVMDGFAERLKTSLKTGLATEIYIDGNAAGNEDSWHGLESMFGTNGTINASTGAQRAANAADLVGYPSDTYAELSTQLGTYGGDQEANVVWPDGMCDPSYDFWTPLIVCYNSTGFGGAADTWAAQGDEAMRYAIIHSQRNSLPDGQVSNIWVTRTMFYELKNLLDGKESINVNRNEPNGLVSLGFRNVINFDGVDVSFENAIPAGVGYGINISSVELRSMYDQLFFPEGPEYDMDQQRFKSVASTLSNLKFMSPRNYFKLLTIAS